MPARSTLATTYRCLCHYLYISLMLFSFNSANAANWQSDVKTVHVNNYDMAYVEHGTGKPLVLIHGVLNDYRSWLPLMKELSETSRVIAVSLRHYYPEHWDGKGNDLTLQQHADDVAEFIKAMKLGPVDLVGHSRGGAVVLLAATRHPELIRHLLLAEPAPFITLLAGELQAQKPVKFRLDTLQTMMQHFNVGNTDAGLQVFIDYVAGESVWENTQEDRRQRLRGNQWTVISLIDDMYVKLECAEVSKITSPTLFISGDRSDPLYGYMYTALQGCIKHMTRAVIGDAGHLMFQANPTAFIFEVQEFVAPQ